MIDVNHAAAAGSAAVTPFHVACTRGHTDVVKFLLDRGADMKVPNGDGLTPLQALSRAATNTPSTTVGSSAASQRRAAAQGSNAKSWQKIGALLKRAGTLPQHLPVSEI